MWPVRLTGRSQGHCARLGLREASDVAVASCELGGAPCRPGRLSSCPRGGKRPAGLWLLHFCSPRGLHRVCQAQGPALWGPAEGFVGAPGSGRAVSLRRAPAFDRCCRLGTAGILTQLQHSDKKKISLHKGFVQKQGKINQEEREMSPIGRWPSRLAGACGWGCGPGPTGRPRGGRGPGRRPGRRWGCGWRRARRPCAPCPSRCPAAAACPAPHA